MDQPGQRNSGDLEEPIDRQRLARLVKAHRDDGEMFASINVSRPGAVSGASKLEAAPAGAEPHHAPMSAALSDRIPQQSVVETKSRRSPLLFVAATILAIILLVAGIVAYFVRQSNPIATNISRQKEERPSMPVSTNLTAGLVEIAGGTFKMGRNDGPPQERPEHPVTVQTFSIDRTEVTNAEYEEFVRDTNYQTPSHWLRGQPIPGQEQWPVVNVSPRDAQAFAAWRSKRDNIQYRLPTEEEWEFAARSGGEFQLYPWGNRFEEKRAVVKEASPRPVGSYPQGANRWGVLDLIGNVWEWTSSKASLYTGGSAATPGAEREWVVARGGSYSSDPTNPQIPVSATYRDWYDPTLKHPNFGFRLARSK